MINKRNLKHPVCLSDEDKAILSSMLKNKKLCKTLITRAHILIALDCNGKVPLKQSQIAAKYGIGRSTINKIISDYWNNGIIKCMTVKRNPTQNRKRKITGEQEARLIQLACSSVPEGHSSWSLILLRDRAVELNIIDPVAIETVRSTLKKTNCSPTKMNIGASPQNVMENL